MRFTPFRLPLVVAIIIGALVVTACSGSAVTSETGGSADSSTTSVVSSGGSAGGSVLDSILIRPEVRLDPASTTGDGTCRTYDSASPPFTMVSDLADDLEADGWTITERFDTGKLYDATASAAATKGDVTLRISAVGTGTTSAAMTICLE